MTPLLHKLVAQFRASGIRRIVVIRGYAADKVHAPDVEFVDNDEFEGTGELLSLSKALDHLEGDVILSFGDILFRKHILNNLLAEEHDIVIAVDAAWERRQGAAGYIDYITATRPYSLRYDEEEAFLTATGPRLDPRKHPRRMDWADENDRRAVRRRSRRRSRSWRAAPISAPCVSTTCSRHLLEQQQRVQVLYITGHWLDVDDLDDLARAQAF